jgi:ParB/RepB/Spo0J family partition protein
METVSLITIAASDIGERYADLRIIQPTADKAMERSMRRYGQLTPVVVGRHGDERYEMVDGFKRLRAGRKLGYPELQAKVMAGSVRVMKAAIIHLNTKARTIADLETALVIQSLCRQDGLSQVEIAALLDRHKSFVCRRLQLVEKLSGDVIEHLKLGLINITIGRELARLPAGNQNRALATVIKYRFSGMETHRLVNLLLKQPRWNHESITGYPAAILNHRHPDRLRGSGRMDLYARLIKIEVFLSTVTPRELKQNRAKVILPVIERIETALAGIRQRLL